MTTDNDFVIVQKRLFDCLRQHCEDCSDFDEQLQDLSNERVVFFDESSSDESSSKKRKTLHEAESQESLRSSQQLEQHLSLQSSQEHESQLLSQSSNTFKSKKLKNADAKRSRERSQQKSRKNATANWFLRNASTITEWRKRQIDLELNTVEQYEQVIQAFIDCINVIVKRQSYQKDKRSEHELVNLVERYVLLTRDFLTNVKLQKFFVMFQAFILLSYCEVLRKRDVLQETLDSIIQHINDRQCDCRRLLDSVLWINDVIVALVSHDWMIYRITELFFIDVFFKLFTCEVELIFISDAIFITYLIHIRDIENLQLILEHLKKDEFIKHDYSDCLEFKYIILDLIVSLLDACNIMINKLSYEFSFVSKDNTDELELMKYASFLITTLIAYQSQLRAYTRFMLLLKASSSSS